MAKYDFFISYSSKDKDIAFKIVTAIESAGYTCWIAPRNIPYGTPYASAIMEGIDECNKFIVLITKNSVQSNDVLNEVDNAHSVKKTIIPVRLTETPLSRELNYYLSRTQWLTLPSSKPEEIVKLLNIGVAPNPTSAPNRTPDLIVKKVAIPLIAVVIIAIGAMLIWQFSYDKTKDVDKDNSSFTATEETSDEASNVDSLHLEENSLTQSTTSIERIKPAVKSDIVNEHMKSEENQYAKYKPEQIKKLVDSLYNKGEYVNALPMCIYIADSIDNNYSHMVGHMYQYGQGVPQNPITAIQWYKRIAHYHSGAHDSLIAIYEQLAKQCVNVGNNKDAAHWYEELAAQYMNEKKYKEAAHWYELGDKTGFIHPNCKYWLGYLYYQGQGVTKDLKKAKDYWEQAATEKDIKAKEALIKYFNE